MAVGIKDYSMPLNGRKDDGKVGGGPPQEGSKLFQLKLSQWK